MTDTTTNQEDTTTQEELLTEEATTSTEGDAALESGAATTTTEAAPAQKLTAQQEINALRSVHQFLANFDRVPGSLATPWGQALDTIAMVANSLIVKATTPNSDA